MNGLYALQNYSYSSSTGNLSSKDDVIYTYGDSNHAHAVTAMGSGSDNYSYDANGNQVTRDVSGSSYTLSYDTENRMTGMTVGSGNASFVYDGDGNRVQGIVGGVTTTYIGNPSLPSGQCYFEWVSSTSNMKKYYYAGSTRGDADG